MVYKNEKKYLFEKKLLIERIGEYPKGKAPKALLLRLQRVKEKLKNIK
jgi:HEPN domain-containing protein